MSDKDPWAERREQAELCEIAEQEWQREAAAGLHAAPEEAFGWLDERMACLRLALDEGRGSYGGDLDEVMRRAHRFWRFVLYAQAGVDEEKRDP